MENMFTVSDDQIDQLLQSANEQCKLSFSGKNGQPIPESMARRNARERTRVHQLNATFDILRKRLPLSWRKGRLSKCGVLKKSTEYIQFLLRELSRPVDQHFTATGDRKRGRLTEYPENTSLSEGTSCSSLCQLNTEWQNPCDNTPMVMNGHGPESMPLMDEGPLFNPFIVDPLLVEINPNSEQVNFSSCMYDKRNLLCTSAEDDREVPNNRHSDVPFADL